MNKLTTLITACVVLLAVVSPARAENNLNLESGAAKLRSVSLTYMLEGVVEAELDSTISAQTAGVIREIRYEIDDFVDKGAIVAVIDDKQQQAAFRQAEAARKESSARLQEASSEYERARKVYRDKVISKADFERSQATLDAARARLDSATAAVAAAREQLDYTQVRAPFSGIVTQRLVETGEAVNVGTPLMSGFSLYKLRVKTQVPQSIVRAVRERQHAIIITDDSEIVSNDMMFFPFADPHSHSFELRVKLPQVVTDLLPGMFVKVAMEVDQKDRLVIPFNAVAFRGEVTGVYVLHDSQLQFRHVRLGKRLSDNEVVVVAGLTLGERVVLDPVAAAIVIKQQRPAGG